MRPRFLICLLIFVLVAFGLVFWLRPKHSASISSQGREAAVSNDQPTAKKRNGSGNMPNTKSPSAIPASIPSSKNNVITPEKWRNYIESHNHPVDFYGLVIDQNSNPIPGVKIKSGVRHWTMPGPEVGSASTTTIPLKATTGADGRFELTGASGDGFGVLLFKDGYEAESEKNGFGAGSYSYANPVIFKMWKADIHEKLITGSKVFPIVPDGRSYLIDLIKGTISEASTGDLKIWVKRPAQIAFGQRYDWSCEMEVMNGELLQENDRSAAMYEAPANGYTNSFSFTEAATASGWGDTTGEQRFYVRLNGGREYGRISIELEAYYNNRIPALIRISYAINPSGSRILR